MAVSVPPPPYVLRNATVPVCVLEATSASAIPSSAVDASGLALVDITVDARGVMASIAPAKGTRGDGSAEGLEVDLSAKLVLPTFADLHTHIDKGHTWQRSPNPGACQPRPPGSFARAC